MLETSVRLLRLLSLLQVRRDGSGADLAAASASPPTVRNDIERLRILGYEVHSSTGITGGYRLGAGSAMPPLLLDDDEAVAVAVGLRAAAASTVTGIEETSLRALTKLQQTMPARLRHRLDALRQATVSATGGGPTVDAETLSTPAATTSSCASTTGGATARPARAAWSHTAVVQRGAAAGATCARSCSDEITARRLVSRALAPCSGAPFEGGTHPWLIIPTPQRFELLPRRWSGTAT